MVAIARNVRGYLGIQQVQVRRKSVSSGIWPVGPSGVARVGARKTRGEMNAVKSIMWLREVVGGITTIFCRRIYQERCPITHE